MLSLNKKILYLENKIRVLESKMNDITRNVQSKPLIPYTKIRTSKGQGWWFVDGKWCTYAIYSD